MEKPSPSISNLARRLLAASRTETDSIEPAALRICETLRIILTRFTGADGFNSLLSRALALACADIPSLKNVTIGTDGRLQGFAPFAGDASTDATGDEAAVAITTHLLNLLVIFIGEPLTLALLHEAWPAVPLDHPSHSRIEADS